MTTTRTQLFLALLQILPSTIACSHPSTSNLLSKRAVHHPSYTNQAPTLLFSRQSCTSGILCGDGCIPTGYSCCSASDGTSCPSGFYCDGSGIEAGCCENGETCSGLGLSCPGDTVSCGLECLTAGSVCENNGGGIAVPSVPLTGSTTTAATATTAVGGGAIPTAATTSSVSGDETTSASASTSSSSSSATLPPPASSTVSEGSGGGASTTSASASSGGGAAASAASRGFVVVSSITVGAIFFALGTCDELEDEINVVAEFCRRGKGRRVVSDVL